MTAMMSEKESKLFKESELFMAIRTNQVEAIKSLLTPDHISSRDSVGNTPLHCAIEYGNLEIMQLLIKAGADVNAVNMTATTPLHVAALFIQFTHVVELCNHGANPKSQDIHGYTALHYIVQEEPLSNRVFTILEIIRILLKAGVPINALDKEGDTALQVAIDNKAVKSAEYLISRGATVLL